MKKSKRKLAALFFEFFIGIYEIVAFAKAL
jgi:hypothetical protein